MTIELPAGLEWEVWRVVSSERYSVSLVEVQERWSLTDLLDAHIVLDLLEDAEHRQAEKHRPRKRA